MNTPQRILVATDFSPVGDCAARRAALIARQFGAEFHLLHVVHPLKLYPGHHLDADALDRQALAAASKTRLDVVHVLEPELVRRLSPGEREAANAEMRAIATNQMDTLLAGLPGANAGHIETGYVPARILELAEQWRTDLIAVGRHGHGGLEEYLLGSVSKDISQAAGCDVLIAGAE